MPVSGIASDSRDVCEGGSVSGLPGHRQSRAGLPAQSDRGGGLRSPVTTHGASGRETDAAADRGRHLGDQLGEIANRFYGHPSQSVRVLAVTGTNGKTTVAWLLAQCLQQLGRTLRLLGTLGIGVDELDGGEGMTTPAASNCTGALRCFVDAGATARPSRFRRTPCAGPHRRRAIRRRAVHQPDSRPPRLSR